MKMKKFIVAIIASSVVLTGCSSADNSVDLNVSEFSAKSQEPGVISLDVRTAGEFAEGHLVNAININVESGNFEAEIESLDKKNASMDNQKDNILTLTAKELEARARQARKQTSHIGRNELVLQHSIKLYSSLING